MRLLFVPGMDINSSNANAVCCKNVVEALEEIDGIDIDVLNDFCLNDSIRSLWKKDIVLFIKRIIHWPSIDPDGIKRCIGEIESKKEDYDAVIVSHKPYESVVACLRYYSYKNHPKILLYELDPMTSGIDSYRLGKSLSFITDFKEKKIYSKIGYILHMECNKKKYSIKKYDKYRTKSFYLDFPLIYKKDLEKKKSSDNLRFIYSGMLDSYYRNPCYLLSLLDGLTNKHDYIFDFFSKGDCESLIDDKAREDSSFVSHGFVSHEELDDYLINADFLINIGNKYSEMLPSKLLNYMNYGKPIIHISNQENDSCIEYLKKYDNSLIIKESDDLDYSISKLEEFISSNKDKVISQDSIIKTFYKNTPQWSAEQIIKIIKG